MKNYLNDIKLQMNNQPEHKILEDFISKIHDEDQLNVLLEAVPEYFLGSTLKFYKGNYNGLQLEVSLTQHTRCDIKVLNSVNDENKTNPLYPNNLLYEKKNGLFETAEVIFFTKDKFKKDFTLECAYTFNFDANEINIIIDKNNKNNMSVNMATLEVDAALNFKFPLHTIADNELDTYFFNLNTFFTTVENLNNIELKEKVMRVLLYGETVSKEERDFFKLMNDFDSKTFKSLDKIIFNQEKPEKKVKLQKIL